MSLICTMIKLRELGVIDNLRAVHVNYSNKVNISDQDAYFCKKFCEDNRVEIFVREITEIKKAGFIERDAYEDYTQEVRFDTYKRFCENYDVFLGHNESDVKENIIQNVKTGKRFYNIRGMSQTSVKRGVRLHRPLLRLSKSDIFDFMKEGNHTINTTLPHCARGIMRRKKLVDDEMIPGLFSIADRLEEYYKLSSVLLSHEMIEGNIIFNLREDTKILNSFYVSSIVNGILSQRGRRTLSNLFVEDVVNPNGKPSFKVSNGVKFSYIGSNKLKVELM